MSPYAQTLATARLDALEALVQALKDAETPDEKRRCAVAIFNAPEPCDLDDTVEFDDDTEGDQAEDATDSDPQPDRDAVPSATGSPAALSVQPVRACNPDPTPPAAHASTPDPLAAAIQQLTALLDAAGLPQVSDEEAEHFLNARLPAPGG